MIWGDVYNHIRSLTQIGKACFFKEYLDLYFVYFSHIQRDLFALLMMNHLTFAVLSFSWHYFDPAKAYTRISVNES